MSMGETTSDRPPTGTPLAPHHAVGDDMLAIFGPGIRAPADAVADDSDVRDRSGVSRARMLAIGSVALTAAIAAGTIFGGDIVGLQAPVAASRGEVGPIRAEAPMTPAPTAAVPVPATVLPIERPEEAVRVAERPAAVATAVAAPRPPAPDVAPPPPAALDVPPPIIVVRGEPPARAIEAPVASPVEVAERDALQAYGVARTAGVKPALLRDYRRELERARGEVFDRPLYAERIFGMIAADLSLLADEAGGSAR